MVLLDDPTNARRHSVSGLNGVKLATEASEEISRQVSDGSNATGRKTSTTHHISIRTDHRIGTWNIRGLIKPGKRSIVEKEMESYKLSILGVSETHMRGNGHFRTTAGNTMYFSGNTNASLHGVGIILSPEINKCVLGYNPVSDRIITVKLNTKPCTLNIIQIYAPTSQSSEEELEDFYGTLGDTLNKIPNREIMLILGDWNAKVGTTEADDELRQVVGKYGLGTRNERGTRFIDFCIDKNLCILNTCFQHHPRRLYTWRSPGDKYRNQIDYILINTRWRSSISNTRTFPGAECGTDHNLLVANLKFRLKAPKNYLPPKPRQLGSTETTIFQQSLDQRLKKNSPELQLDSNAHWEHLKGHIHETLTEITKDRKADYKKKTWITEQTWELIQQRKNIKIKGLQNNDRRNEYLRLSKKINRHCRKDKNIFLENICLKFLGQ